MSAERDPKVDPAQAREFALDIVRRLRQAGFQALWAGGCVRDELLGLTPKDYDVATDATPEQIRQIFGRRRTLAIGQAFGVIVVLGPKSAGPVDDHGDTQPDHGGQTTGDTQPGITQYS